jgi:hypothetical protein
MLVRLLLSINLLVSNEYLSLTTFPGLKIFPGFDPLIHWVRVKLSQIG